MCKQSVRISFNEENLHYCGLSAHVCMFRMNTIFQDFMPDIFLIKTKAFDTSSTTVHKVF